MVLQLLATAEGAYPADVSRSAIAPTLFKGIASPGFRDSQIYYSAQDRVIRRIELHACWVRGADECRLLIQKIEYSNSPFDVGEGSARRSAAHGYRRIDGRKRDRKSVV